MVYDTVGKLTSVFGITVVYAAVLGVPAGMIAGGITYATASERSKKVKAWQAFGYSVAGAGGIGTLFALYNWGRLSASPISQRGFFQRGGYIPLGGGASANDFLRIPPAASYGPSSAGYSAARPRAGVLAAGPAGAADPLAIDMSFNFADSAAGAAPAGPAL